ncbi:MAG: hypothetical protein ABI571_06000, partial [Actinomycetota bacterium]
AYEDIALDGPILPALLRGRLEFGAEATKPIVAIAMNGTIVAMTKAREDTERGGFTFQAMLPPRGFRNGTNDLRVFLVEKAHKGTLLLPVQQE